jgi:hypothetical protein
MTVPPNKSPEPSSVVAVHTASWQLPGYLRQTMNSNHLSVIIVSAFMAVCNIGCVHQNYAGHGGPLFTVSLPPLKLAQGEYVESVEIDVLEGRIATINRTWDDWDTDLFWDSPDKMIWKSYAGHFGNGFEDTQPFSRFITVQTGSASTDLSWLPSFDIMATVHTESTDNLDGKDYKISGRELILSPKPDDSIWRKRGPWYPDSNGVYCVQWGYSAEEIAAHFHLTMEQLSKLNPGADLSNLPVGRLLYVSEQARK